MEEYIMRNFVFGDTGGHSAPLFNALLEIGADIELGLLPPDVRIIHLGDLIHKGNDSKSLLRVVDKFIRNNPNQWIQILGNHEFQHIQDSPYYFWRCDCDDSDVTILNDWFEEGLAAASYAATPSESFQLTESNTSTESTILFSHAGLTWFWWDQMQKPSDAYRASEIINALPADVVTAAGEMLGIRGFAGPVWATGNNEVFNSWNNTDDVMPFMQMHGHTTSFSWTRRRWWRIDAIFDVFKNLTVLNPKTRAVVTRLSGNLLIGIDPGFSKTADLNVQPYVTFSSAD
jgi:hypothetical protein